MLPNSRFCGRYALAVLGTAHGEVVVATITPLGYIQAVSLAAEELKEQETEARVHSQTEP